MAELELGGFTRSPGVAPPPAPPAPEAVDVSNDDGTVGAAPSTRPPRRPARRTSQRAVTASAPTAGRVTVNVDISSRRWLRSYSRMAGMTLAEVLEAALDAHGPAVGVAALVGPPEPVPLHLTLSAATRERLERLRDDTSSTLTAVVSELLVRARRAISPAEAAAAAARRLSES